MPAFPLTSFGRLAAKPPPAGAAQRIGLLGGSFDPPHAAHLLISEIALKRLALDRVWWIVTPGNPLKQTNGLPPIEDRAAACRALASDPRIVVTTFEADLPSSYTAATLDFLATRYPGTDFAWIMGADCLAQFHKWQRWRHIFETIPVAVVDRPGWRLKAAASPAATTFARCRWPENRAAEILTAPRPAWTLLSGPLSPLSSTALRLAKRPPARRTPSMT